MTRSTFCKVTRLCKADLELLEAREDGGFGVELLHVLERHQRLALLDRFQVPEPAGHAFTLHQRLSSHFTQTLRVTLHKCYESLDTNVEKSHSRVTLHKLEGMKKLNVKRTILARLKELEVLSQMTLHKR